jgi:hypothetical protein
MSAATKPSDVELIESQLMDNAGAGLPNRAMGTPQAPRMDPGALPTALPPTAFPAPVAGGYGMPQHPPPAVPPPHRGSLDDYAFPVSLFIITIIVLSPYVGGLLKRFLPPTAQGMWPSIVIKAGLVTLGFVVLDKLNQ